MAREEYDPMWDSLAKKSICNFNRMLNILCSCYPGVLRWNPGATRAMSSHEDTNSGELLNSLAEWRPQASLWSANPLGFP